MTNRNSFTVYRLMTLPITLIEWSQTTSSPFW